MKVVVSTVEAKRHNIELPEESRVAELLVKLEYPEDAHVVVNRVPITADHVLSDGDTVHLVRRWRGRPIRGEAPLIDTGQLSAFTAKATHLTIIDPYILLPRIIRNDLRSDGKRAAEYVELLVDATNLRTLKSLHLVYQEGNRHTWAALEKECARWRCELTKKRSERIHDRIWIKNDSEARSEARVVGTYLNGANSRRLAFELPLPPEDLEFVLQFMRDYDLMPPR